MSHITKIKAQIKDLDALADGCFHLGMEVDLTAKRFRNFAGRMSECNGALRIKGNNTAYEMGLVKNKAGHFDLEWDDYGGGKGLVNVVGKNAGLLLQEYSAAVAIRAMSRQGMRVRRTVGAGGKVILTGEA